MQNIIMPKVIIITENHNFCLGFQQYLKNTGEKSVKTTDRHCFSKRIIVQSKSQICMFIQPLFKEG